MGNNKTRDNERKDGKERKYINNKIIGRKGKKIYQIGNNETKENKRKGGMKRYKQHDNIITGNKREGENCKRDKKTL